MDRIYCEDCAFFKKAEGRDEIYNMTYGRCLHPNSAGSSLRNVARILDNGGYADICRGADYLCGPEAKWFQAIEVTP
jgi:hypothetical protein